MFLSSGTLERRLTARLPLETQQLIDLESNPRGNFADGLLSRLAQPARRAELRAAGIARVRCTDSLPHPCGTAALAPVLADALRGLVGRAGRR